MIKGDRIRERLIACGKSQAELAREIKVSPQAVSKLIIGGTNETAKLYQIARFLETTPEYLTGESDDAGAAAGMSDKRLGFRGPAPERDPDAVEIDHIDLQLGMGGAFIDGHVEVSRRTFSRSWLRQITHSDPANLAWTRGDGDSMEPTIRTGEIVLIDRSKLTPGMDDKIWAITIGDIGMIKRLRALPSGTIEIHSDNPHVSPAFAADGELHVIGRVVAVVRRL